MTRKLIYLLLFLLASSQMNAQEELPFIAYDVPSQNLLKYNRFLINPTFSTVREDKSYVNLLHRNQSVSFDDNDQLYFLSYSGRVNDRTGLGLSLYTQRQGILSNYGVLANYAYGIKLSDKSNFTFGANLSYYSSGIDESRANPIEIDPFLSDFEDSSFLSFQPGFNISYGPFDFGLFAENLFDYNMKTSKTVTEFKDKTYSGHLQYTYPFENQRGVLEGGRLMPLARARAVGQEEFILGGNLILDLPKIGWLQGGYDSFYGASAGLGFNLNRRVSIGYTMEKGLNNDLNNFGLTHEISFAYSFTPNLTEDRVMLEDGEELANNEDEEQEEVTDEAMALKDAEIEDLKRRLTENDAILAELIFRQDSMEMNRERDLENRFEMVMRMVRAETQGERPDLEEKAKKMYFINNDQTAIAENTVEPDLSNTREGRETLFENTVPDVKTPKRDYAEIVKDKKEADAFTKAVQQKKVNGQKFRDLEGVADGYYVVANVYRGEFYMNKFMNTLNDQGLGADYIDNPKNGMKYVYIDRFDTWNEALAAYKSKFGGNYDGDLWIMNVEQRYSNEAYAANSRKVKEKASEYEDDVLQKNVVVRDKVDTNGTGSRTFKIDGVGNGYYIIANVFANPKNANRFVKLLNARGLNASYFVNPENNYRYVYLKRHQTWTNALISYYSNLNESYDDKMWIMRVTPNLIT
ncbi:MAG: PorP/SprF family type IX secretion system membrane protein [Flavobacteriaceae bacterium]